MESSIEEGHNHENMERKSITKRLPSYILQQMTNFH